MLFNPNWLTRRHPIFSFDSLIAWAATKDPNEEYEYCDQQKCLLAQYFTDMGFSGVHVDSQRVHISYEYAIAGAQCIFTKSYRLPYGWDRIVLPLFYGWRKSHTFGAALERARRANTRPRAILRAVTFGLLG